MVWEQDSRTSNRALPWGAGGVIPLDSPTAGRNKTTGCLAIYMPYDTNRPTRKFKQRHETADSLG
eukprot:2331896-Amphidinium_carterae.1